MNLKIINDDGDSINYQHVSADIQKDDKDDGCLWLKFTVRDGKRRNSDKNIEITYRVHTDIREPDREKIYTVITAKISAESLFEIEEYLRRSYIYIEYGGVRYQYTAQKL